MGTMRTEAEGFDLVAQWQASGLKVVEYAKREDITACSLQYWIRRYRRHQSQKSLVQLDDNLIEIGRPVAPKTSGTNNLAIVFPSGVRVEIGSAADLGFILSLVARL